MPLRPASSLLTLCVDRRASSSAGHHGTRRRISQSVSNHSHSAQQTPLQTSTARLCNIRFLLEFCPPSAPANRRHHLFPLCTTMTRSRRTKVRGGGTALSRPACHWPHDKAANSTSLLQLDYCFASACHSSLGLLEEELTTLFHTDAPCTTSSTTGGMASSPRFPFCLLMQRLFDNLRRQSFWNNVKRPCSDLWLPRKEPSK